MKRFILILFMFLTLPVFADTMPFYVNSMPKTAIGLYQTDKTVNIYSNPDSNSKLIKQFELTYKAESMPDNVFALLLNDKELGFLYVTDVDEEGWVEVVFDKLTGAKGWVKAQDRMQFLPWINFYNLYGRKYGIKILKDAPENIYTLHAKSEESSQSISKINYVQKIKLTKVSGNWALVTVVDLDKTPKTGWMKWRDANGTIYAFPDIK